MPTKTIFRSAALFIAAVSTFLLFYLGAKPIAVNLFPEPWDKAAHFVFFGGVALLLSIFDDGMHPFLTMMATTLIGATDELHQSTLPGRSVDATDLATDAIAAACGVLLYRLINAAAQNTRSLPASVPDPLEES